MENGNGNGHPQSPIPQSSSDESPIPQSPILPLNVADVNVVIQPMRPSPFSNATAISFEFFWGPPDEVHRKSVDARFLVRVPNEIMHQLPRGYWLSEIRTRIQDHITFPTEVDQNSFDAVIKKVLATVHIPIVHVMSPGRRTYLFDANKPSLDMLITESERKVYQLRLQLIRGDEFRHWELKLKPLGEVDMEMAQGYDDVVAHDEMRIIIWTVEDGGDDPGFPEEVARLCASHDPSVLIIISPGSVGDRAHDVCSSLALGNYFIIDSWRGGVWTFWAERHVHLSVFEEHNDEANALLMVSRTTLVAVVL